MSIIIKLIQFIFLGIVQGFTEPLPISSSGHVLLVREFLGIEINDINFEIIVNAGSMIAIIILFRKKIVSLIIGFLRYLFKKEETCKSDFIYIWLLVLAVIPAGIVGLLFKSTIETYLSSVLTVGLSLIVTGTALMFVGRLASKNSVETINMKDAIVIGLFQVLALIPGISRSGSTMVGGLTQKVKFESVMEFSFLLYIPISIATIFSAFLDFTVTDSPFILGYIFAFIASVLTTFYAVKWFFGIVRKGNLQYFSYYCFIVGGIVVIYSLVVLI